MCNLFFFDIYDLNIFTVLLRLVLAVILGGLIGLERGAHKHPAGFRTHILVCVGAALAMLTNQYIYEVFDTADPARLGAQVITGVGFLGVGTILVTGRYKIRGLTTAAGLWASACIGLAAGIGFYSGAIAATVLVLISLSLLPKLEAAFYQHSRTMEIFVELDSVANLKSFTQDVKEMGIAISEAHVAEATIKVEGALALSVSLRLPKNYLVNKAIDDINSLPYVIIAEEI
jgi:putative Mg2+ transporter-C (MgtC) family protein